jgi:hypothetical protein
VGEQRYPGWVLNHPARATRWVRAATTLMVPKEEDAQIYTIWGGVGVVAAKENETDEAILWRKRIVLRACLIQKHGRCVG